MKQFLPSQPISLFRCRFVQVSDLQERLSAVTAFVEDLNVTVTLSDICFAPLSPDNEECTIQSVVNYFQNNRTRLDYNISSAFTIDYTNIDHIQFCATLVQQYQNLK